MFTFKYKGNNNVVVITTNEVEKFYKIMDFLKERLLRYTIIYMGGSNPTWSLKVFDTRKEWWNIVTECYDLVDD